MERVKFSVSDSSNLAKEKYLRPFGDEALAVMKKLDIGEDVSVEIYRPRDNTFSARAQLVFQRLGQALGGSVRNVRGWLAAQTGRADAVIIGGKMVLVPWGTGPRDMRNEEFEAFWSDAREIIEAEIMPTLDDAAARDVMELMRGM
jgi:hypothetical protein